MLWLPPAPVVFDPNPVGQLIITNGEDGVRLLVNISRPLTEDIMVFGQAPCSAGRSKRRNVSYLGLVSASQARMADITALYTARYGEPRCMLFDYRGCDEIGNQVNYGFRIKLGSQHSADLAVKREMATLLMTGPRTGILSLQESNT